MNKTKEIYGYLWSLDKNKSPSLNCHYLKMQEVISDKIVKGTLGIEIGSGSGLDTFAMANENPLTKIISLDISDGVKNTKKLTQNLKNAFVVKASALNLPFKSNKFDFAYSFGVIHHTNNPPGGVKEIKRVVKQNAPVFLYLYEDHSENLVKYYALKAVTLLRRITVRIPTKILYIICWIFSPVLVITFSYPAKILSKFQITKKLSEKMPFNFGKTLFSLRGDLYDRFGAPIEERFSRYEAINLLKNEDFININITRLKATAGWVLWGRKTN